MRSLIICLSAVAVIVFAACGDDPNGDVTAVASPVASAAPQTPAAACPTPPAGPVTMLSYKGPVTGAGQSVLSDLQATSSACSDTVTFTFAQAGTPAYQANYVAEVTECGSGELVTTAGTGQIYLRLEPAAAHNEAGQPSISGRVQSPNFPSVKELKLTCDFEAVVAWAIGTAEKYFTVTTASSPSRIIVEVYH